MALAPSWVGDIDSGPVQTAAVVAIVLGLAAVGQALLSWIGGHLRARVTWRAARTLDSTAGALVSVLALLVFVWFLASALRAAPLSSLNRGIARSQVLQAVDSGMPDRARGWFSSFRSVLDESALPRVFSGIGTEPIAPVAPPEDQSAATPGVRAAGGSIVKVTGVASSCQRRVEGSGFVYAPGKVMTNAHVVAGVSEPVVQIGGRGRTYKTRVVVFDPDRDVAVLDVEDLDAPALSFRPDAGRGDESVVAGFPGGGPYHLEPARVRDAIRARGHDIYSRGSVTRDVLSLYATVQPGNSGGPLLAPDGGVYGLVFAKSLDDARTGYALSLDEIRRAATAGRAATEATGVGTCTPG
jgi:S1-C subfamily serine protease